MMNKLISYCSKPNGYTNPNGGGYSDSLIFGLAFIAGNELHGERAICDVEFKFNSDEINFVLRQTPAAGKT